ncbi:MAG: hypothetical protein WCW68_12565 [Methanothrix sp.]
MSISVHVAFEKSIAFICIMAAESREHSREDALCMMRAGANALLIGDKADGDAL